MTDILAVTTPIFLLIGLGYAAVRLGFFAQDQARALGAFVINVALPALIIRALSQRPFSELANLRYLALYGGVSLVVFAFGYAVARLALRRPQGAASMIALGGSISNSGLIAYQIATLAVGPTAGLAMALNMAFENVLLIPLSLAIAEAAAGRGTGFAATTATTARRLARHPLLIAIVIGAAMAASGLTLPRAIERAVDMLANAAGGAALFSIGGALVGLSARGLGADVALIAVCKLLIMPALIWIGLHYVHGIDPILQRTMMIFAAAPMVTIYPLIAQAYGEGRSASAALLATTALSFFTVSAVLYYL
ncbi:MAG: AEC family transporter [Hyphomicrobiales bacterium]|nr:AEC family transporter [Hyphomicrobiales bacterium]